MASEIKRGRRRAIRIVAGFLLLALAADVAASLLLRGPLARALLDRVMLPAVLTDSGAEVHLEEVEFQPLPLGGLILGSLLPRFGSGPHAPYIAVRDAELVVAGTRVSLTASAEFAIWPSLLGTPRLRRGEIVSVEATLAPEQDSTDGGGVNINAVNSAAAMVLHAFERAEIPVRRIVLRDAEQTLFEASGEIRGDSEGMVVRANFTAPAASAENGTLDLAMKPDGEGWTVSGTLAAEKIDVTRLAGQSESGAMVVDARAALAGVFPTEVRVELGGTMRSSYGEALSGGFSAKAWWRPAEVIVNDLVFSAPGLDAQADAAWSPAEGVVIEARRLLLKPQSIRMLGAMTAGAQGHLSASDTAEIALGDALAGFGGDAGYRIVRGNAHFSGLEWRSPENKVLLAGLRGEAAVVGETFEIKELRADGLRVAGKLIPQSDGAMRLEFSGECDLAKADISPWLPVKGLRLSGGTARLDHFNALLQPAEGLGDLDAAVSLNKVAGVFRSSENAEPVPWRDLAGRLRYAEDTLTLEGIRAEGAAVDGSLTRKGAAWRFDLSGSADLAGGLARAALAGLPVSSTKGELRLTRLRGTMGPEAALPSDLEIEGALRNGAGELSLAGTRESLSGANATFRSTPKTIEADINLAAGKLGPIAWKGTYLPEEGALRGVLRADLALAAQRLIPADTGGAYPRAALAAFGPSDYAIEAGLKGNEATISLRREAPPTLIANARVDIARGALLSAQGETTLRVEDISAALPGGANGRGPAPVAIRMDGAAGRFTLDVQLDEAEITVGQYITKRAGQAAGARIEGATAPEWRPEALTVSVMGQVIPLRFDHGAVVCDALDLRLAPLAALLPEGATASGRLHGRFHSMPPSVDLYFDAAGMTMAPGLGMDRMDGRVRHENGALTIENMRLQGANSDCTVEAGVRGGAWEGRVSGNKLDLMAVLALWNAAQALQHSGDPEPSPARAAAPAGDGTLRGRASVAVSEVYLRRAVLREVQTEILLEPEEILFDRLRMRVGEGSANGALRIQRGGAGRAAVTLQMARADMRVLDGLLESPREIFGAMDGTLQLSFTPGAAMTRDMTGKIEYTAFNGSYGKAGMGTKVLTAFRATELVRLRMPRLRDEGLVFDESHARLNFQNGVMNIELFDAISASHAILAEGKVDFARDETDVQVQVHLLESVTGVLGKVPVVGKVTEALRSQSGLRFRVTGPVSNPQVSPGSPINPVRGVREGGRSAGDALRSIGGLFRSRGGE